MVGLHGIRDTLKVTNSPNTILLKILHKQAAITFKNGTKLKLTWSEFLMLRDLYEYWSNYRVEKTSDNLFKFTGKDTEFVGSLELAQAIFQLVYKHNYSIKQTSRDLFSINGNGLSLIGSSVMIHFIKELADGIYRCDCAEKTVLDIGGFEGETAAYFYSLGAKKVIVYEPIPAYFKKIEQNMSRNGFDAELHNQGIGAENGTAKIEFCDKESVCSIKSTALVLSESHADIAKIDVEGAEEALCDVPNDILRSISLYMIEVHSKPIRDRLVEKFVSAGFSLTADFKIVDAIDVIHFKRQA